MAIKKQAAVQKNDARQNALPDPADVDEPPPDPNRLHIDAKPGDRRNRLLAEVAMLPHALNTRTAMLFSTPLTGELDLKDSLDVMLDKVAKAKGGDLSELEGMLTSQAVTLNAVFNEMARRAGMNMGEYMQATQTYMQLALKAQTQCRTTIQTLAEIKNPRPVAFVKQANISHGSQQVNNGTYTDGEARACARENLIKPSNELLGVGYGKRLDTGTPGTAGGVDQELATLGTLDGA